MTLDYFQSNYFKITKKIDIFAPKWQKLRYGTVKMPNLETVKNLETLPTLFYIILFLFKGFEKKIKDLSSELSKQSNSYRTLKTENEKLSDKLKLLEEKLNHTERDNQQKKQLIEFYKKKLDEAAPNLTSVESDVSALNECRQQLKKSQEAVDKLRGELKTTRTRAQNAVQEKQTIEEALEKTSNELSVLKKERIVRLESSLKQAKVKIADLESQLDTLGNKAETRIKSLSETSQQTVDLAQV